MFTSEIVKARKCNLTLFWAIKNLQGYSFVNNDLTGLQQVHKYFQNAEKTYWLNSKAVTLASARGASMLFQSVIAIVSSGLLDFTLRLIFHYTILRILH